MSRGCEIFVRPETLGELDRNEDLLQTGFWARLKEAFGWRAHGFLCRLRGGELHLLVLTRTLAAGLGLAYIPHGPACPAQGTCPEPALGPEELLAALGRATRPFLPRGCLFCRFDLPWGSWSAPPPPLANVHGLHKAVMDIQPPSTVILDLDGSEEQLLAGMKSKTRYNIRLASQKGVEVREGGVEDLAPWYDLYRETARRDRITLHSMRYYRRLFELAAEPAPAAGRPLVEVKLLLARAAGELLAGTITAFKGGKAWYLYGASSDRRRNLMPNYALQWKAIQLAKAAGCRHYDLFGIPPSDDPNHPLYGLYRFKTGFGGRLFHACGCYDLAFHPFGYGAYRLAERMRSFYYRKLRKGLAQA